jgi:anti-sigma factor RsiW
MTLTGCKDILANISSYLDGDLDHTACGAIEQHCRECPSCAELVAGLRTTVGLCRQAGETPLPEPVRRRAQESVQRLLAKELDKS